MYLIPSEDITLEGREKQRQGTFDMLIHLALRFQLATEKSELRIRDILPEDLELVTWATPGESGKWISVWPKCPIAIYKVLQLNAYPSIHTLEFRKAGCIIAKVGIEGCYSGLPTLQRLKEALLDPAARAVMDRLTGDAPSTPLPFYSRMEGYFSEPIVCPAQQHFEVNVHCHKDSSCDYLLLGGFIVEPMGMTTI